MIELWYIDITTNNHNSQVYIDMVNDMRRMGNGVFTCTFKLNDGFICDYLTTEQEVYAEPATPETNPLPRQQTKETAVRHR